MWYRSPGTHNAFQVDFKLRRGVEISKDEVVGSTAKASCLVEVRNKR